MKKKFKLLTSIASLGLALALGVFGVLAATNQVLNINSSVSFTSTTVLANFQAKVEGAVEGTKTYAGHTADAANPNATIAPFEVGALTFDESHTTITYTVDVTNKSNFAVKCVVTGVPSAIDGVMTVEETTTGYDNIAASTGTYQYKLVLTLLKFDTNIPSTNVNLVVTVDKAA